MQVRINTVTFLIRVGAFTVSVWIVFLVRRECRQSPLTLCPPTLLLPQWQLELLLQRQWQQPVVCCWTFTLRASTLRECSTILRRWGPGVADNLELPQRRSSLDGERAGPETSDVDYLLALHSTTALMTSIKDPGNGAEGTMNVAAVGKLNKQAAEGGTRTSGTRNGTLTGTNTMNNACSCIRSTSTEARPSVRCTAPTSEGPDIGHGPWIAHAMIRNQTSKRKKAKGVLAEKVPWQRMCVVHSSLCP